MNQFVRQCQHLLGEVLEVKVVSIFKEPLDHIALVTKELEAMIRGDVNRGGAPKVAILQIL
jgi:hypothetical protein